MSLAVLTEEQLEQLFVRALEPLRQEVAALREARESEAIPLHEAARRLGVSTRTIQRMVSRGELTSVKVGGARRVHVSGLLAPSDRVSQLAGIPPAK